MIIFSGSVASLSNCVSCIFWLYYMYVYFVKENSSSNRFLFGEFELSFLGLCLQSKSSVYIMYLGRNHSVGQIG